jgi:amino acid transporter
VSRTVVGLVLVIIGVVIAIVSGLAHEIGLTLSSADAPDTFGGKQVVGLAFGVAVAVIGLVTALTGRGGGAEGAGAPRDQNRSG